MYADKPWAPPGWQVRFYEQGRIVHYFRESHHGAACDSYLGETHIPDGPAVREQVAEGMARGLFFTEPYGRA
jgi:hypothetical protein